MTTNVLKLAMILAMASAAPVWADDVKAAAPPESPGKGAKDIAEATTPATVETSDSAGVAYQSQHATIMKECGVDLTNEKQLLVMLQSWDEATKSVVASAYKNHPDLAEKLKLIDIEMASATESNNADLVRDMAEKRRSIVEVMGGWSPEAQKQLDDLDAKYRGAVREMVAADKIDRLDEILHAAQDAQPNRPLRAPVRSPRALKAIVDRLGDLTTDQRKSIDGAFLQFREVQRANSKQSTDNAAQEKKLYDDVFAVLTDGQKTRVEQELVGRTGATPAVPKAPATPGSVAAPSKPVESKKPVAPAGEGAAEKP